MNLHTDGALKKEIPCLIAIVLHYEKLNSHKQGHSVYEFNNNFRSDVFQVQRFRHYFRPSANFWVEGWVFRWKYQIYIQRCFHYKPAWNFLLHDSYFPCRQFVYSIFFSDQEIKLCGSIFSWNFPDLSKHFRLYFSRISSQVDIYTLFGLNSPSTSKLLKYMIVF